MTETAALFQAEPSWLATAARPATDIPSVL